jgi:hypothetical protein
MSSDFYTAYLTKETSTNVESEQSEVRDSLKKIAEKLNPHTIKKKQGYSSEKYRIKTSGAFTYLEKVSED